MKLYVAQRMSNKTAEALLAIAKAKKEITRDEAKTYHDRYEYRILGYKTKAEMLKARA